VISPPSRNVQNEPTAAREFVFMSSFPRFRLILSVIYIIIYFICWSCFFISELTFKKNEVKKKKEEAFEPKPEADDSQVSLVVCDADP